MYSHPQHSVTLSAHVRLRKLNIAYVIMQDQSNDCQGHRYLTAATKGST